MKRKLSWLLLLAMLLLSGNAAFAIVSPGNDFYYLDNANVLSEETECIIYFCNQRLYEQCGGQIVIAALDSIGDEDIYDYAYDLFNDWGIGSATENNGLLLLLAIEEDNYYAISGAGVDRIFSSSVLQEYLDEELEPDFAAGTYEDGVLKFFGAVLARYADFYNLNINIQDGEKAYHAYKEENSVSTNFGGARSGGATLDGPTSIWHSEHKERRSGSNFLYTLIFILAIVFILSRNFRRLRRGSMFFVPFFRSRPYHNHHVHHTHVYHNTAPRRTPPRSSGFGGSAGRSSFGSGRSGGFGGARGGGGRSFGGGAGRGRR